MLTIVSGGQTGVDRAALDVAIELGIAYRGWCPKGGWAEDQPSPPGVLALYAGLRETPDADPRQRTEWNVRDSDRLMVLVGRAGLPVSRGTDVCARMRQVLWPSRISSSLSMPATPKTWRQAFSAKGRAVGRVNIGGPRESEAPGIYAKARDFLRGVLSRA